MNILISGGAGFVGSHLTDALLEAGHFVACADNLILGSRDMISHHFENKAFRFYEMDICDELRLEEIFEEHRFDRVYHLAANSDIQKGGTDPAIDIKDTLQTTLALLQAMKHHNVRELLFASTSAVYGDKKELLKEDAGDLQPVSYYGGAKLASEAMISAFAAMNEMSTNIIRFPNVVGPRLTHGVVCDFIKKLRATPKKLEILGDGNQEKPYIYISDLIEAMLFMKYQKDVNVYNVGVETTTTVRKVADIVREEMGLTNVEYEFTGGNVGWKGDVAKFQYDLTEIHGAGWTAKYTSDEAVRLAARSMIKDEC